MRYAKLVGSPYATAIKVVTFSGDGAETFVREHVRVRTVDENSARVAKIVGGEDILDEGLLIKREEVYELHLHGNDAIVEDVCALLERSGAVQADPWDLAPETSGLSARKKMLLRLAADAKTDFAATVLLREFSRDETVESRRPPAPAELVRMLLNPTRVLLVGPGNAGKSTLANYLSGENKSAVASVAGTTADLVVHRSAIHGFPFEWWDIPGMDETVDPIAKIGKERAKKLFDSADGWILVAEDLEESEWTETPKTPPAAVVLSKADLHCETLPGNSNLFADVLRAKISVHRESGLDELQNLVLLHFASRLGYTIESAIAALLAGPLSF
ncbi:MAG: GTP-binding protein [Planctomycetes bacterium]|nr:GTP-binding protein [Planctomycetota bacterium]